jgi:acyl-CoA hydrolase
MVKVDASIIYTGRTSMHIAVDVRSRNVRSGKFQKTTHCIIVFVAVDSNGQPQNVPVWEPKDQEDIQLQAYAVKLMNLRKQIEEEMRPFAHK